MASQGPSHGQITLEKLRTVHPAVAVPEAPQPTKMGKYSGARSSKALPMLYGAVLTETHLKFGTLKRGVTYRRSFRLSFPGQAQRSIVLRQPDIASACAE